MSGKRLLFILVIALVAFYLRSPSFKQFCKRIADKSSRLAEQRTVESERVSELQGGTIARALSIRNGGEARREITGKVTRGSDGDVDALNAALEKVSDAETQFRIGVCYAEGKGLVKDEKEAVRWYRKAADQGHDEARHLLANCYCRGTGVAVDRAEALRLWRIGAAKGYARSIHNVGTCYMDGLGVEKDYAEALKWYRRAAEMGFASSQVNMGAFYLNGYGVEKDEAEALKWYRKAAANGMDKVPEVADAIRELEKRVGSR